ncbi:hypothetical protein [Sporosarcina sp. NPDC096371]|uniref:hypothetical protein n=1 Tax=Sporosarcina sp. NPDC096371 TaxID=3364530 RepID=UPI0037F1D69C
MNTEMMHSLVDRVIKIDRGGPESRVGKLLTVEEDYITLLNADEGIIYYNTQHIKSLTYNAKDQAEVDVEIPEDFDYIQAKDFKSILGKLTHRWVKINRGGPETLEGLMYIVSDTDDFITIVANEEIVRVSLFHIRNISYGVKIEKAKNDENNNQESGKEKSSKKEK